MAHVDQAKKARIAAAVKQVMPSGWKYSIAVRHHSTIVLTISAAPFDLLKAFKPSDYFNPETATNLDINVYNARSWIDDECVADVIENIIAALNTENFDKSDSMTDYFHVGHYVDLKIGRWDKPFTYTPANVAIPA